MMHNELVLNDENMITDIESYPLIFQYHYSPKIRKMTSEFLNTNKPDWALDDCALCQNYYSMLKSFLPQLEFIELPESLHKIIPSVYNKFEKIYFPLLRGQIENKNSPISDPNINWFNYLKDSKTLSEEENCELEKFEQKITHYFQSEHFVKLSCRSPKDSPVANRKREIGMEDWMKCTNSIEAIELLITSNRISSDLLKWKNIFLIISPWIPTDTANEFRCFVCRNCLTAVSQYSSSYLPNFKDEKDRKTVEEKITQLVNQVIDITKQIINIIPI
ncbi:hypothetical protein TRFO_14033 [Tritrichomonas foetus]|uniref:Uncharacterized protein n=1 Tax=Tritrichomonas foetus TaxID=1144522 RepID=A0A1J4KWA7_9EUKA|nr:hypothetical protein TRFO_14033 [Tritrichomonas foetus]|eukprot:OHT15442.1 hypothetical protein TRFO_14033 [Tritrichomonas foetus]